MKTKKVLILAVMGMLCLAVMTACVQKEAEKSASAQGKPVYIIGLDDTFAPLGFTNEEGEIVGFDIDLAKEIGRRKNIEFRFQPIDWTMKETELNSKKIDMIWNGYTLTEKRKEKVDFSDPYFEDGQIIITLKDSDIQTIEDMKGKILSLQGESTALDAVKKQPGLYESMQSVVEYPSNNEVFQELETGRCDVIVVDEAMGRYYMKRNDGSIYGVLDEDLGAESMAVGFRKGDDELRELINEGLRELKEDGTYDEIVKKWFAE